MDDYDSEATKMATISSNLNSGMLTSFLWGMYTIIYAGTVYVYMSNKTIHVNRRIILTAISILYTLCFAVFSIQWFFIDLAVVVDGDSRESIFVSVLEGGPEWIAVLFQSLAFSVFIVSDALLIWRCYHVWGQCLRIILVPLFCFLAEFALFVVVIIDASMIDNITSASEATLSNVVQSSQIFMSLSTTVITASLIAYRIYSTLKLSGTSSKGRFTRIVDIVVQSAGLYSVVILVYAVITIVVPFPQVGSFVAISGAYLQSIITIVGGMAPTVLVARIALSKSITEHQEATITRMSGIQFGAITASRSGTVSIINSHGNTGWDEEAQHKRPPV